eukprot:Skav226024  [mRNA]  locus=scaffold2502:38590:38823:- [translate_table: standard]
MVVSVPPAKNFRRQMSSNITTEEDSILLKKPSISVRSGPNSSCPTRALLAETSNIHSRVPNSMAMLRMDRSTELKSK